MEHTIQESKKQYALVLILIPQDAWRTNPTLPMNIANNLLRDVNMPETEFVALNPCTFWCSTETAWRAAPHFAETARVYNVETQILFLDQKPSWITS